jgi:hypothetical protein
MRTNRTLLSLLILVVLTLACSKTNPGTQPAQATQPLATAGQSGQIATPNNSLATPTFSTDTNAAQIDQPTNQGTIDALVDGTLALRGVQIGLSTTQPDGSISTLDAQIDGVGNQHLLKTFPESSTSLFSNGAPNPPTDLELYVLEGVAYAPDENGIFRPASTQDMSGSLKNAILSPDGPGFWLKVLPEGSLISQGNEEFGGYQAIKYAIQGTIDGQTTSGTLWVDSDQQALLGAQIDLPASLYGPQDEGNIHIDFQVKRAEIEPIQPEVETSQTTSTSSPTLAPDDPAGTSSDANLPADVPLYPDAAVLIAQPGVLIYQSAATVETINQFYIDQLTANGWQTEDPPFNSGGAYYQSWIKDDLQISISISPEDEGSMVTIACESCATG